MGMLPRILTMISSPDDSPEIQKSSHSQRRDVTPMIHPDLPKKSHMINQM
jgi:hypothetical protein